MPKFPLIPQHDSMQCGIACLAMVTAYYGKAYSLDELSRYCFATTEGVSLLGISEAAGKLGLHTSCGRLTANVLRKAMLPCILHWNQNHFVVLYKIKRGRFYIADPGKGLVTYREAEFREHWLSTQSGGEPRGVALLLQPTPDFYEREAERPARRRSFKFLLGYVRQYRQYFGQIILGLLVGCVLQLIFPFLTQAIVDVGITHHNLRFIYLVLLAQLMLTLSQTGADFIRRWILLHISMRINISLVSDFFIKLLKLPMSFFDTKLMGDLLQRMNDHKRVEEFLTTRAPGVLFALLSFVVLSSVLCVYNGLIFAVFLLGSLLYGVWLAVFMKKRRQLDYQLFEQQAINNNKTYQFITTMQEIKLQDCEQRRRWEWEDVQADLFDVNMKTLKLQQGQEAGGVLINQVKDIVITILAATAVIQGNMTLGMMLAVQYIIGQLGSPISQLVNFIYSLQDVKISLERINEIHDMENEGGAGIKITPMINPKMPLMKFEHVDFKYDPHSPRKTLDDISLRIPAGKVTAIVGTSGSGKTTLIKLLLGYYKALAGRIEVGLFNIDKIDLHVWRRMCGVVMQDGVIFSESIARNIAVDDGEIDKERLLQAARIACIDDYIEKLPLGYNTLIGPDGIGLSQGQKQRILIARAVYKDPVCIFLDEATNALDANNERAIVENLREYYKGRTVVVVAHRLSTVKDADQIVVIEKGRIVETGNHVSLVASQGAYYQLVRNQLELGN
ncbi:MAG: peptidase domain-containing ABC transporter [Mediterranea sp.]|nr:peptidase domain-containing ABC transporter [Mediterranea sp.]